MRSRPQANLQEGRHALARTVFHGGELRQRYSEGMEDQLGDLGLVLNAIVLFNTRYLDARDHPAACRRLRGPRGLPLGCVSTLVRLVAARREAASQQLWEALSALIDDEQQAMLDGLLEVPEGERSSRLDTLRRPPTRVSGPAMVVALERAAEIHGLGAAEVDTSVIPPRRWRRARMS